MKTNSMICISVLLSLFYFMYYVDNIIKSNLSPTDEYSIT